MKLSISRQLSILIFLLISAITSSAFAEGYKVSKSKSFSGKFRSQTPIEVGLDVNGVKLGSVYFDKKKLQAFVILQNRTPVDVLPTVGVAIFDKKGRIIASGIKALEFSFLGDTVRAGEQKNIKLSLNKFVNNFKKAHRYQIVFSLGEKTQSAEEKEKANSTDDF